MQCKFVQIGEALHRCRCCGFVVQSDWPSEAIHKECHGQYSATAARAAIEEDLAPELAKGGFRPKAAISRTLDACFAGCEHFDGWVCTRFGSPCRYRQRWMERLLLWGCDKEDRPGAEVRLPLIL